MGLAYFDDVSFWIKCKEGGTDELLKYWYEGGNKIASKIFILAEIEQACSVCGYTAN